MQIPLLSRYRLLVLAGAFLLTAHPVSAREPKPLPPELALIPPDAAGFVTVRVAHLLTAKPFGQMRQLFRDSGKELQAYYSSFYNVGLEDIERGTVVWPNADHLGFNVMDVPGDIPSRLLIVTTRKPLPQRLPIAADRSGQRHYQGFTYYRDATGWTCLHLVGDRSFVLGSEAAMRWLLDRRTQKGPASRQAVTTGGAPGFQMKADRAQKGPAGPLAEALRAAGEDPLIVLGLQPDLAKRLLTQASPAGAEALQNVVGAVKGVTVTVADRRELDISARLTFATPQGAAEAADAFRKLAGKTVAQMRPELAQLERGAERRSAEARKPDAGSDDPTNWREVVAFGRDVLTWLERPPITLDGATVSTHLRTRVFAVPFTLPYSGLLYVTLPSAPSAYLANEFSDRDRALAAALAAYHDEHGHFPPPAIHGGDGKPLLSWRVAVLPYLGDEARKLHAKFKLGEPWDSPHNKRLLDRMPWTFSDMPQTAYRPRPYTPYRVFVGRGSVFEGTRGISRKEIKDDPAQTFLVVRGDYRSVPWTKPEEIVLKDGEPPPLDKGGFIDVALFADGSVREVWLRDPVQIRAGITRAGGEKVKFQPADRDPAKLLELEKELDQKNRRKEK